MKNISNIREIEYFFQILTYDDLLRDKELMKAMKEALLEYNEEDFNESEEKPSWAGKTIYELLSSESLTERSSTSSKTIQNVEESIDGDAVNVDDVFVGLCLLEHDLTNGFDVSRKEHDEAKIESGDRLSLSAILEDGSTSSLRALERGDSGEEEQLLKSEENNKETDREVRKRDRQTKSESQVPPSQAGGDTSLGIAASTTSELFSAKKLSPDGGETQLGTSLSFAPLTLFQHPAILAACYCLACLHQLTGLDFVTSVGILMAMISMVAMFFF